MKLKSKKHIPNFLLIGILVLAIIGLSIGLAKKNNAALPGEFSHNTDDRYNHPTVIEANQINYKNLIESKEGLL